MSIKGVNGPEGAMPVWRGFVDREQSMSPNQPHPGSSSDAEALRAVLSFESEPWAPGAGEHDPWMEALDPGVGLSAYHRLTMAPFRLSDLVSVWHFASRWNQGVNIILDCEVSHARVEDAMSVLRTLHHRTVDLVGTDNANGLLVLDDDALALYAASFEVEQLQMVRVDGPIDRGDVLAMLGKSTSGESVMDAELRASASIEFRRDGPSIVESRCIDMVAAAVGTGLACYVSEVLGTPRGDVPRPPLNEVMQLLGRSGSVLVRPEDVSSDSGMIDVGICTSADREEMVVDTSLSFSPPDGTWRSGEAA